eukprot:PhF_6_TR44253/c0_g1_i2/m.68095
MSSRPVYPSFFGWWVPHTLVHLVRGPALAVVYFYMILPILQRSAELWQYDDRTFFMAGTLIIHAILYFGMNTILLLFEKFKIFESYKLPRSARMAVSKELFSKTILEAVIGQIVVAPISLFVVYTYVLPDPKPQRFSALPDPVTLFLHFAGAALTNEVLFYLAHRLFHEVPILYQLFHKKHHQYVGSIGFAAEYADPVEQVLANQGPTALYCFAMGVHPFVWFTWLSWRLYQTFEAHSGYCFRGSLLQKIGLTFSQSAIFHDYHHSENKGNYGSPMTDYLGRSMDSYLIRYKGVV